MRTRRILHVVVFAVVLLAPMIVAVTSTAPVALAGPELVPNGSMNAVDPGNAQLPLGWQTGGWGSNTRTFTSPATGGVDGTRFARVTVSGYSTGDAKWWFAPVPVSTGTTYSYRDVYRSAVTTLLVAEIRTIAGATSWLWLRNVPAATTWTAATTTLSVPAGTATLTVYHLLTANGTLDLDDVSCSSTTSTSTTSTSTTSTPPTTTPPATSTTVVPPPTGGLVPNPSVETPDPGDPSMPQSWAAGGWGTNTRSFTYLSGGAHSGTRSLRVSLTSRSTGDAKWYHPQIAVSPNTTYTFSDWYRSSVTTHLVAEIHSTNGAVGYTAAVAVPASATWANATWTFTTAGDAATLTVYHLIQVVGSLDTDDTSLVRGTTTNPTTTTTTTTAATTVPTTTTVPTWRPVVYLTFDDGPGPEYTSAVLDMLAEHPGVHVTFFPLGSNVRAYPWLSADVVARGHEIGNHSDTHTDFTELTATQIAAEVTTANNSIFAAAGVRPTCVRPPYGYLDTTASNTLAALGMSTVLWTHDTDDWRTDTTSVQSIVHTLDTVGDGSIVLMHEWAPNTLVAVDQWLTTNANRYDFRTLPQC